MQLAGAVALVTGAAVGTGRAIAQRLRAEGADVIGADIAAVPGDGRFLTLDVTDDAALTAAVRELSPTILVNNAGGGGHIPPHFPEATVEQWSALLALNLRAPMVATQLMRSGVVVNIASSAGAEATPHASPEYATAKAGLIRFTTSLDLPDVRVHCIVPGWVLTDRARDELAEIPQADRPEMVTLEALSDAVVALIGDDGPSGRVVTLP